MSLLRYPDNYPSDGGARPGAPAHRSDEFPAGHYSVGWSPPEPASSAGPQDAIELSCRPSIFPRASMGVFTVSRRSGGNRRHLSR